MRRRWFRRGFSVFLPVVLALFIARQLSWRPHALVQPDTSIQSVVFSPDGKILAMIRSRDDCRGDLVQLYEARSGTLLHSLFSSHPVDYEAHRGLIAFSSDSQLLATAGGIGYYSSNVCLWETTSGHLRWQRKSTGDVRTICFAPDHKTLLTTGNNPDDSTVFRSGHFGQTWDLRTGKQLAAGNADENATIFSPDATKAVTAYGTWAVLRDISTKTPQQTTLFGSCDSAAFSSDNQIVVTNGLVYGFNKDGSFRNDGTVVQLWSVPQGKLLRTFRITQTDSPMVLCSAQTLIVETDARIEVQDLQTGKVLHVLRGSAFALSPNGTRIATEPDDKTVVLQRIR